MRQLLITLFIFAGLNAWGQGYVPFANSVNKKDTARSTLSLRVDSALRLPKYANTDTTRVLSVDGGGNLVWRTKGNGVLDTTSQAYQYSVAARDGHANTQFNAVITNLTKINTSGGTTILTDGNAQNYLTLGSSTQTFQLPLGTSLHPNRSFFIQNGGIQNIYINLHSGAIYDTILPRSAQLFYITDTTSSDGTWAGQIYFSGLCAGCLLVGNNANNVFYLPPGTAGQVLTINASTGVPYWAISSSSGGTITSFSSANLSPLFTSSVTNPTTTPALSFALSNAAANTAFGNLTASSGAPSYSPATPTNTATSIMVRDANKSCAISHIDEAVTVTATAGGTTTLTNASSANQEFTGSSNQTIKLEDATTDNLGRPYFFINKGTGTLTIQDNGSNNLITLYPNMRMVALKLFDNSTSVGGWIGDRSFDSLVTSWPSLFTTPVSASYANRVGALAVSFASATQNLFLATPNGSSGIPGLRAIVSGDIPTLSSLYVDLLTAQLIGGIKTFSSTPVITGNGLSFTHGADITVGTTDNFNIIFQLNGIAKGKFSTANNGTFFAQGLSGYLNNLSLNDGGNNYGLNISSTGFVFAAPTIGNIASAGSTGIWSFLFGTKNNSPATTVNCSTSGTINYTMPEQGTAKKEIWAQSNACIGTAVYTLPTSCTNAPVALLLTSGVTLSASTTTTVTFTGTGTNGLSIAVSQN